MRVKIIDSSSPAPKFNFFQNSPGKKVLPPLERTPKDDYNKIAKNIHVSKALGTHILFVL